VEQVIHVHPLQGNLEDQVVGQVTEIEDLLELEMIPQQVPHKEIQVDRHLQDQETQQGEAEEQLDQVQMLLILHQVLVTVEMVAQELQIQFLDLQ
jgi:hypothetical protein